MDKLSMMTYLIGVALTFGILLNAFLKDPSTPKTDIHSWLVLLVSTLLWFVVLPFVIRKKWLSTKLASSAISN